MNDVPILQLSGTPRDRGFVHGQRLAGRLRAFLDDSLARLGHLTDQPIDLDSVRGLIASHRESVAAAVPHLAEEVDGLAEGAALDPDEAWLLQLRREILGYSRIDAGGCTAYASIVGRPVLAQTVDLNGNLGDQMAVLAVSGPRHRSVVLSFAGLLGFLGLNGAGVAVGLNLLLGGQWESGVPPYLAVRHLLDNADSVDHAVEILRELPLASSRSFMICGRDRTVCVETMGTELAVLEGDEVTHTNHYLHPEFVPFDQMNIFAKNSSGRRLDALHRSGIPAAEDIHEHRRLLGTPPIYVPETDDIRRDQTVAGVLLRPDQREMRLWPGDPSVGREHVCAVP